jgi:flagellar biosynthetic protein FliQ
VSEGALFDLLRGALTTIAIVGAPFIGVALAVGLTVSLLQAATQLQENVLSFVPKVVALGLLLALAGPWALSQLAGYAQTAIGSLPALAEASR